MFSVDRVRRSPSRTPRTCSPLYSEVQKRDKNFEKCGSQKLRLSLDHSVTQTPRTGLDCLVFWLQEGFTYWMEWILVILNLLTLLLPDSEGRVPDQLLSLSSFPRSIWVCVVLVTILYHSPLGTYQTSSRGHTFLGRDTEHVPSTSLLMGRGRKSAFLVTKPKGVTDRW